MYFDAEKISIHSTDLKKSFNNIKSAIESIEKDFDSCCNNDNWDSKTRDYFNKEYKSLKKEIDKVYNLFLNINNYIEGVIGNYENLEQSMNNAVSGAFSNFKI